MRAAAVLAAITLAGCAAGTSNGFSATAPGGWEDRTDVAETRTGAELEVVYEGATVEGIASTITVSRVEVPEGGSLQKSARAARAEIADRFAGVRPGPLAPDRVAGAPALRFDYGDQERRARAITAEHAGHLYAITLQTAPSGFARGSDVLRAYLASWRWDEA